MVGVIQTDDSMRFCDSGVTSSMSRTHLFILVRKAGYLYVRKPIVPEFGGPFAFSGACAATRSRAVQLGCDASCDTEICNCRGVEAFASGRSKWVVLRKPTARQMARLSSLYGHRLNKDNIATHE
ncbi:unnamed protein product [Pieris macdunnoughi]|uniref:Uncharacterized protein n=1 Tax=Pieris macdunnoughi TaxID=345717 RepID=A0A821RAY7_9NEOP|nr:unnamed protein product [Pieris macdunnoughi]